MLPDHSIWSRFDSILDNMLPGSLPFQFINSIASSHSRLGRIYDTQLLGDDDATTGARRYLQGKQSSMTLDWKSG